MNVLDDRLTTLVHTVAAGEAALAESQHAVVETILQRLRNREKLGLRLMNSQAVVLHPRGTTEPTSAVQRQDAENHEATLRI